MIPSEVKWLADEFFLAHSDEYDLSTNEGCGEYTEAFVVEAQHKGFKRVGHLKKYPGQTQYNGHANDAFLYREAVSPSGLYSAVDIIASAEAKPPYTPSNPAPSSNFDIDIPRYTDDDWFLITEDSLNMVPWISYNEQGFQQLKNQLAYDYWRKPQGADFDVTVWAARVFHSAYMGPDKTPLGLENAIKRHRPEWCAILGVPVDNHWV